MSMSEGQYMSGGQDVSKQSDNIEIKASLSKKRAVISFLSYFIALMTFAAVAASLLLLIFQTKDLNEIATENRKNSDRLVDCTTPGGTCFEKSNARTGEAIDRINQITILASYCAMVPGNDTKEEIKLCIEENLPDR